MPHSGGCGSIDHCRLVFHHGERSEEVSCSGGHVAFYSENHDAFRSGNGVFYSGSSLMFYPENHCGILSYCMNDVSGGDGVTSSSCAA